MSPSSSVDASWFSGVRRFSEKRKGPVYELSLKRNWQGRYKAAEVWDGEGALAGRIAPRRALLGDGGKMDLPSGARLRVRVVERFTHDEIDVRIDGREPVWRAAEPARVGEVLPLLRKAGLVSGTTAVVAAVAAVVSVVAQTSVTFSRGLEGKDFVLFGVGALFGFLAYAELRNAIDLLRGPRSSVARALEADPSSIAWVYGSVEGASAFDRFARDGAMSLHVNFLDRSTRSFRVPARKWESILALFAARAPNALFGYTKENASKFNDLCKRAAMRR